MSNRTLGVAVLGISLTLLCHAPATRAQATLDHPARGDGTAVPTPTAHQLGASGESQSPSSKQMREADDAYLKGAKQFAHKKFDAAQRNFERAFQLDPYNQNYVLALLFTHETRVTRVVQEAVKARQLGETTRANALLSEGRALSPSNPLVAQYFEPNNAAMTSRTVKLADTPSALAGPIEFEPCSGKQSFHLSGDLQDIVRNVYNAFGIAVMFDPSVRAGTPVRFDVNDVDFDRATWMLAKMGGIFDIPMQPTSVLIAKDTKERRDALMPLVEATIYLPGQSQEQMTELANLARDVFDLKQVTVNTNSNSIVIRGEEDVVNLLNGTYADLLGSQADVLLDLTLYEIDRTNTKNIGFAPPTTVSAIDVSSAAQSLINSNQTLLNQSIANGSLTLTGSTYAKELEEVEYLVAAGVSGSSEFTSLLGTLGSYQGIPLTGISIGSTTFNLLLSSTDIRTLDKLQIRTGNAETATFRVGSRYPILTSVSTASTSSALVSELEAAGVSSATIAKYGGSTSTTTIPQIQFEDLGITLKVTPHVMDDDEVRLLLDLKIEAIAGTGVDDIPILDNHALASTVTVPGGTTTMLSALVSTNEAKLLDGAPGLNDLPGFQSTDQSTDGTDNELLITITPHIVRNGSMRVIDRSLAMPRLGTGTSPSSVALSR